MPKRGYRQSDEHRRKIGEANRLALKGRTLSTEHIAHRSLAQIVHGESRRSRLYETWDSMIQRCTNPKNPQAKDYGGRGITVYPEWTIPRRGFKAFRDYVLATIGPKPAGLTLDRIDNDGSYVPGNLRWATRKEQQANRRNTKK